MTELRMTELNFSMPSTYQHALSVIARNEQITINEALRLAMEEYGKIRNAGVLMLRERPSFLLRTGHGRYTAVVEQRYLQVVDDVMRGAGATFNQAMEIIIGQYVTTYAMNEYLAEQDPSACV